MLSSARCMPRVLQIVRSSACRASAQKLAASAPPVVRTRPAKTRAVLVVRFMIGSSWLAARRVVLALAGDIDRGPGKRSAIPGSCPAGSDILGARAIFPGAWSHIGAAMTTIFALDRPAYL